MLKKEHLNRKLVISLYFLIIVNILLYLIAVWTSFGLILLLNRGLVLLIIMVTPVSIVYSGYVMIKKLRMINVVYFVLSIVSVSWIVLALYHAASVMSNF